MLNVFGRGNNLSICFVKHYRKLLKRGIFGNKENVRNIYNDALFNHPVNCNKSSLLYQHQNILHNKIPYNHANSWIHLTEKYQRKIFGRYGVKSGVDTRICFNTKLDRKVEQFEKLSELGGIIDMITRHKFLQKCKSNEILMRQEDIINKLEQLDEWKRALNSRIMKKEADARAAKEKRDRLIEEVRRHFGYKVDSRDDRFKEVLEQKERDNKKKQKEAKRKEKEEKLMSKLVENSNM